jgi:hypothetical protein
MDKPQPLPVNGRSPDRLDTALTAVRQRLGMLRWLLPVGMFVLVVIYELGFARWALAAWGAAVLLTIDIAVYGVLGPLLAAVLLDLLGRWIDERETTAVQAQTLARVRERVQLQHDLADDTLQTLFAASTALAALEEHTTNLPAPAATQIQATHTALEAAIKRLYASLER